MGRPPTKDLTERELEVMHVFWSCGNLTAAAARDRVATTGLDRTYTTIANLVRGLHDKGFLHQLNRERPVRVPGGAVDTEDVSRTATRRPGSRVFRGSRARITVVPPCRPAQAVGGRAGHPREGFLKEEGR